MQKFEHEEEFDTDAGWPLSIYTLRKMLIGLFWKLPGKTFEILRLNSDGMKLREVKMDGTIGDAHGLHWDGIIRAEVNLIDRCKFEVELKPNVLDRYTWLTNTNIVRGKLDMMRPRPQDEIIELN